LAEAGATPEIVGRLFAEAQRNRPSDRMIHAYAFMLEGALGTLRVQASGRDVGADHTIAAVHKEVDDNLRKSSIAPDVLMRFKPLVPSANESERECRRRLEKRRQCWGGPRFESLILRQ